MRRPRGAFVLGAALALVAAVVSPSRASDWPQRTVRLVLTLGPGSGTDISARLLADRLSQKWGQPVVVENRPGGDGVVAISAFVTAQDDHVLLFCPTASFTAHPYLHRDLPYKPSDLAPIAQISNTIISLSVPAQMPAKSLKDLVDTARAKPGELNWAGMTGALDLMFEGWLKSTGLQIKKVPYRNPVEAANDLAENRVQVYDSALAIVRPHVQSGKVRVLAVTNTARASMAPDVPTVKEAGYPALTLDGLVGLFGPANMPKSLRERIAADIKSVMDQDAAIRDRLIATGQVPNPGGPDQFARSIEEQRAELANATKPLGMQPKN